MAMNDRKLPQPESSKSQASAKNKTKKHSFAKWFREMKSELKKVVWPSRKQIVNNTLVALLVMVVAGVVIWGFDELASAASHLLISIGA